MAWKLNILPPFKGYSDSWYKDKFGTYGYANQSNYMKNIDLTDYNCLTQGFGIKSGYNTDGFIHHEIRPMGAGNFISLATDTTNGGLYLTTLKCDLSAENKLSGIATRSLGATFNPNNYPLSCGRFNENDYFYFYNKETAGEVGLASNINTSATFDDDWGSTIPAGKKALQNAPHPVIQYSGKMLFGNGRYLGVLEKNNSNYELDAERYDFSDISGINNAFVVDMCVNGSYVYVGTNIGDTAYGTNSIGEINIINYDLQPDDSQQYLILQKIPVYDTIGSMISVNGIVYVIHGDQSTNTFKIGYISGGRINDLKEFSGDLPKFHQLDYIQGQITFTNGKEIYSLILDDYNGSVMYSKVSGKYENIDTICNINGLTLICSHNTTTADLSYIKGKTKECIYRTTTQNVSDGLTISTIKNIGIETNPLGENARCDVYVIINQNEDTKQLVMTLEGKGVSRHSPAKNLDVHDVESFCLEFDWTNGSDEELVKIRKININGEYGQRN